MTTIDSTVFGVASTGGGGGSGVVKYKPGIIATPGDEIRSMKDYDVYLRWSKEPEALQLSKDPADDPDNFFTTNALAPVGGYAYINNENPNLPGDFAIIDKGLIRNRGCLYTTDTSFYAELPEDANFPPISKDFIFKLPVNTYQISSNQTERFNIISGDYNDEGDLYFLTNVTSAASGLTAIANNGFYKMTKDGVISRISPTASVFATIYTSMVLVHLGGSNWLLTEFHRAGFYSTTRLSTDNCQTWTALSSGSPYNVNTAGDLVVTTSGKIFVSNYSSVNTSVGTNLFYEFVIDQTTLKWTTVPVTMPDNIPTLLFTAYVNIVAIPGNKLFVCHGNENNYIYDVDTSIFQVVSSVTTGTGSDYNNSLQVSNWHAYNPDDNCVYRGIGGNIKKQTSYSVINLSDNKVKIITKITAADYFWFSGRMVAIKGGGVLTYDTGLNTASNQIKYEGKVNLSNCLAYSDYLSTTGRNEAKRDMYTMSLDTALGRTSRYTHKPFLNNNPVVVGYRYDKINVIWDTDYLMSIESKPFIKPLAHTQVTVYSSSSSTVQLTQSKRIF